MIFIVFRNPAATYKAMPANYFKWLLKVQRAQFAFRPDHKGHIRSPKIQCPLEKA